MKKNVLRFSVVVSLFCILLAAGNIYAETDYSNYSTEELAAMRGTLGNISTEERSAFRSEWQKRIPQMSSDERLQYTKGNGNGLRDGSGAGSGQRKGYGSGGGGGKGRR